MTMRLVETKREQDARQRPPELVRRAAHPRTCARCDGWMFSRHQHGRIWEAWCLQCGRTVDYLLTVKGAPR